MLKIALIGYGKMGKMVHETASKFPIEIVSVIDPKVEDCAKEISAETLKDAQVCIDFTQPDIVLANIRQVCALHRNLVVGTTGWNEHLEEVTQLVLTAGIGMLYGSNLSLGMNLFYEIVARAAEIISSYDEYDCFGLELHHKEKADSPSGTAKELGKILLSKNKNKKTLQYDKLNRKIEPEELHFASVRAGYIPGTHIVGFDSEADTIELTHRLRNRSGLALGALKAAMWIADKKGLYTFQDYIKAQV
ncbi:MAG: 4-hydroxy-tetrahydrodipicolinate reductase [Candidatus Cloacimonadaceae bacterium]